MVVKGQRHLFFLPARAALSGARGAAMVEYPGAALTRGPARPLPLEAGEVPVRQDEVIEEEIVLNGHRVPNAYLQYWLFHPEIGLPVSDPLPDGSQLFEKARLEWEGGKVIATHLSAPPPE